MSNREDSWFPDRKAVRTLCQSARAPSESDMREEATRRRGMRWHSESASQPAGSGPGALTPAQDHGFVFSSLMLAWFFLTPLCFTFLSVLTLRVPGSQGPRGRKWSDPKKPHTAPGVISRILWRQLGCHQKEVKAVSLVHSVMTDPLGWSV